MYQTGQTIKQTLEDIHGNNLVLPAIQREFVWKPRQVCRLFDSIMQSYPFGTFLYWRVEEQNSDKFQFYGFARDYHERDNPHCPSLPVQVNRKLTAVLDGQQRLTALNIGLYGSMAVKQPRMWWNNPDAFPQRYLYLDLLWHPSEAGEDGTQYRFDFLEHAPGRLLSRGQCWFRVSDILSMQSSGPAMVKWLNSKLDQEHVDAAYEVLYRLHEVVHKEHMIAYFEVRDQDLDKALQVFVRMNDGGTPLSFSDLLLSIAVAQWQRHDARQEIHSLVDELNRIGRGFRFSKDFVLKAGLMLSDIGSLRFQVENFNRSNMVAFEECWEEIRNTLTLTARLADSFGFYGQNLASYNSLLSIAYYLHGIRADESLLTHSRHASDRTAIKRWLSLSLLKAGIWGSGVDTLLSQLRNVIRDSEVDGFPVAAIESAMASLGKSLRFEDEEIEDLVDVQYGDRRAIVLMSLLFSYINPQHQFHLDHVFPRKLFSESQLNGCGVHESRQAEFRDKCDRLANLQLLEGSVNLEKSAMMPDRWLTEKNHPDAAVAIVEQHLLGEVPESFGEFETFYDRRRERLRERIVELLGRRGDGVT